MVTCEYVNSSTIKPVAYKEWWVTKHCCISQYFLQIVNSTNEKCCDPFGTNWFDVFSGRFLPAPVQFRQSNGSATVPLNPQAKSTNHFSDLWKHMAINKLLPQNNYEVLPYDACSLSVKSAVKKKYICDLCVIHYPGTAAIKKHITGGGCLDSRWRYHWRRWQWKLWWNVGCSW